ncbi:hypothetical protein JCM5350_007891 [Sporobolomyces pararoseus]
MSSRISKTEARGFDPREGIKWTAETRIEAVKKLVRDREQVFAKHRALANSQLESLALQHLQSLSYFKKDPSTRSTFDRYSDFCAALSLPTFPISFSSITLYFYAKRSYQPASYETTCRRILGFRRQTENLWKDVQGLDDLENEAEVERVLKEYIAEKHPDQKEIDSSDLNGSSEAEESDQDNHKQEGDGDGEESEDSDDEDSDSVVEQLNVPNLPRHGNRFSSGNDLLIASYRALIPVYGHGVSLFEHPDKTVTIKCGRNHKIYAKEDQGRCGWRIETTFDPSTREFVVDDRYSYLYHNHGKRTKLHQNPSWRPTILNPVVREAFGLTPLTSTIGKRKARTSSNARSAKKAKPAQSSNCSQTHRSPQFTSPARPSPASFSQYLSSPFSTVSTSPSPSSPFYPRLESFLKGLHPSLAPLSFHLDSAGIDSLYTLTLLCSLEPATLDKFLAAVQQRAQSLNQQISILHLKLFGKLIKGAQDGGFSS